MPFHSATQPSIQIGLLHALAEQAGFRAESFHLNLELATRLTPSVYEALCYRHISGEWLFSVAAFQDEAPSDDQAYLAASSLELAWAQELGKEAVHRLRHQVLPAYIEDCLELVNWGQFRMVGFSSTFQQDVASLALAHRIKERYRTVAIVFGGANMEGEMGLEHLRAFPFIDYVVVGEADSTFPALLRCLATGEDPADWLGIASRTDGGLRFGGDAPVFCDLDALPTPNYDEYFERTQRLGLRGQPDSRWRVPFESSRGCWWGQKHHCTFCSLNGRRMSYRAKSPGQAIAELSEMGRRYGATTFQATDNILPMRYIEEFFPLIRAARIDFRFFYEAKPNLNREQIRTLYQGGVRTIQAGIESLNSRILQLMHKGCTMLQNVRFLKWCRYYKMRVPWSLLWGFPGETEADYSHELQVMRLISHLEPPARCGRFWLQRFSPYFCSADRFPIREVKPEASYYHIYPPHVALERLAYFFEYEMAETVPEKAHAASRTWVMEWQRRWYSDQRDTLYYRRTRDSLFVDDNRGPERRGTYALYGRMALIYEYCSETMRTVPQVTRHLASSPQRLKCPVEEVQAAMSEFCRVGLMLNEDDHYLSLALPANPNW
jgi:ribosomal peptide maturation radical SAM protein 1